MRADKLLEAKSPEYSIPNLQAVQRKLNRWFDMYFAKDPKLRGKGWKVVATTGPVNGGDLQIGYANDYTKTITVGLVNKGKYLGDEEVIDTFCHEIGHALVGDPKVEAHGYVWRTQYGLAKLKYSKMLSEVKQDGWD